LASAVQESNQQLTLAIMKPKIMESLSIDISGGEAGALLSADGRITIDSSPALRDRLLDILRHGSLATLIIDFSRVPYIDTSGLATLIEALRIARSNNTTLHLRVHDRPRYLLEVTGLLSLFTQPRDTTVSKDS
jgi:anti-sigma B factor antagonist